MDTTYKRVTMLVPEELIPELLELVGSKVTELHMEEDTPPADPPKRRRVTHPGRGGGKVMGRSRTAEVIMHHYTPSGRFDVSLAGRWLFECGWATTSANPTCSKLMHDGYLKKIGKERYEFVREMPGVRQMSDRELSRYPDTQP